mgnify:CR=1 FL=1
MTNLPYIYVSRHNDRETPNPFFIALETEIYNSLVDDAGATEKLESEFYVARRVSSYDTDSLEALKARMPTDITQLAADGSGVQLHSTELDFIDFLLNQTSNRVLQVVGFIGVGKSTFLRYIFNDVRAISPSLHVFYPIFINCLGLGKATVDDLIYNLLFGLEHFAEREFSKDARNDLIRSLRDDLFTKNDNMQATSTTKFVNVARQIQDTFPDKRIVFVFDNVDHMNPSSVELVASLTRSLQVHTRSQVVVAMRPPTYLTHSEKCAHKGAFCYFSLEVRPPDIAAVIRRRLYNALKRYNISMSDRKTGFHIQIDDARKSIDSVLDKVLNNESQDFLLRGICNYNVRKALTSFAYFLRYRNLSYQLLFNVKTQRPYPSPEHSFNEFSSVSTKKTWKEHLLDGLIIRHCLHYSPNTHSPPSTTLLFDDHASSGSYILIYLLLVIAAWHQKMTERTRICRLVYRLGFSTSHTNVAIQHLLFRKLLWSPESEDNVSKTENIRITESGQFYIDHLLSDSQYLFNAIFDVPLPHQLWHDTKRTSLKVRVSSMFELLDHVLSEEEARLRNARDTDSVYTLFGAMKKYGLLSQRLIYLVDDILDHAERSDIDNIKTFAKDKKQQLQKMYAQLKPMENTIEEVCEISNKRPGQRSLEQLQKIIRGRNLEIEIAIPDQIGPQHFNEIDVKVHFSQVLPFRKCFLVMANTGATDIFEEVVELERSGDNDTFCGRQRITVDRLTDQTNFPQFRLTLFGDTQPLMSRVVEAPSFD